MSDTRRYHEITADRKPEFVERGYKAKYFFPHRSYYIPQALSEQHRVAQRIWGLDRADGEYSLLMYAGPDDISRFPQELFFDKQVMIHRDHHGLPGLVGRAYLHIDGDRLYADEHHSDLVQRATCRMDHRSHLNRRFGTWHHMLLNSIMHFAMLMGLCEIYIPDSQKVMSAYIKNKVDPTLFERLYDRNTQLHFAAEKRGDDWVIDVKSNREKLVEPRPIDEPTASPRRAVCLVHDITPAKPPGDDETRRHLEEMIAIERAAGVRSTYCVPADFLHACKEIIEDQDNAIAFNSQNLTPYRYLHRPIDVESPVMSTLTQAIRRADYSIRKHLRIKPGYVPTASALRNAVANPLRALINLPKKIDVLSRCRQADFYVYGYRQTPDNLAAGMTDQHLRLHHFAWVLMQDPQVGPVPIDDGRLFKVPITAQWSPEPAGREGFMNDAAALLDRIGQGPFHAINLPSASAPDWLPIYPQLLEQLKQSCDLWTVQDLCDAYYMDRSA